LTLAKFYGDQLRESGDTALIV